MRLGGNMMFTGIIRDVGQIVDVQNGSDERRLTIQFDPERMEGPLPTGESVAVDGVCLTVADRSEKRITVDVSGETLSCTNLTGRSEGDSVNLEPSLEAGDSLGGHFVFGHVDEVVSVDSTDRIDNYRDLTVVLPKPLRRYVARKGSVALNGISLTVNEIDAEEFTVRLVPHTLEHTTLGQIAPGDQLNFEADMLARYVCNYLEKSQAEV